MYKCHDGPFAGYSLALTDGVSAWFSAGGSTGRYRFGRWEVQS